MGYFVIAEFALIARLLASWLSRVPVSVIIRVKSKKPPI
jgi:hypothetical protein